MDAQDELGSPGKKAKVDTADPSEKKSAVEIEPPLASVQKILKNSLPENCQIAKESKAVFARAAGIFIIYLTSCANDFCTEGKRSTISSNDVVAAIKELEFTDFIPPLEEFLIEYRKEIVSKKTAIQSATAQGEAEEDSHDMEEPSLESTE